MLASALSRQTDRRSGNPAVVDGAYVCSWAIVCTSYKFCTPYILLLRTASDVASRTGLEWRPAHPGTTREKGTVALEGRVMRSARKRRAGPVRICIREGEIDEGSASAAAVGQGARKQWMEMEMGFRHGNLYHPRTAKARSIPASVVGSTCALPPCPRCHLASY